MDLLIGPADESAAVLAMGRRSMVYLVTGRRSNDGWPFAGEIVAGTGDDAAQIVRRWGIEPEFVQDVASGRVEFRSPDADLGDGDGGGDDDGDALVLIGAGSGVDGPDLRPSPPRPAARPQ